MNQEKDNNLIKQKIIEGHEETIGELKEQLNKKSNEIENRVQSLCKLRDEVGQLAENLRYKDMDLKKEKQEKSKILHELEVMIFQDVLQKKIPNSLDQIACIVCPKKYVHFEKSRPPLLADLCKLARTFENPG